MRRLTLENGLRLLLDPRPGTSVVEVAVHYGVGFRSEAVGRSGLAHLLEHLMFQGSRNVGPAEHHRVVHTSGGFANAATYQDYTEYYQSVPARALERVLFLESDRMRGLRVTEENLRTQVDVIREEIRLNVTNKPYGGFPWTVLPQVLYQRYANSHDGYGVDHDLESTTCTDVAEFFAGHYAPENCVLTISGRFRPAEAVVMAERHFGGIPNRPTAGVPELAESEPETDRYATHDDPFASFPALALGYRLPDPVAQRGPYLAHVVLARLLALRLRSRPRGAPGPTAGVQAQSGLFGPFQALAPDMLMLSIIHGHDLTTESIMTEVDQELDALSAAGPGVPELQDVSARACAESHRAHDSVLTRVRRAGAFEVLHGEAELVDTLPGLLLTVGCADIVRVAARLRQKPRAALTLLPGRSR